MIGLVGSRQANSHLVASAAGAVVRLRPAGNTTADQRKVYPRLQLCAHVHKTKLSAGCPAAKRELPRADYNYPVSLFYNLIFLYVELAFNFIVILCSHPVTV